MKFWALGARVVDESKPLRTWVEGVPEWPKKEDEDGEDEGGGDGKPKPKPAEKPQTPREGGKPAGARPGPPPMLRRQMSAGSMLLRELRAELEEKESSRAEALLEQEAERHALRARVSER
jgi:hypothetical protein